MLIHPHSQATTTPTPKVSAFSDLKKLSTAEWS
jgi:hypothetical protein